MFFMSKKINYLLGILLFLMVLTFNKPCFAINNPDLLPKDNTPVLDLAKTLSPKQKEILEDNLNTFEKENGWKIKYLSQFESSPGLAIKDFWDLDDTSLLIVADPRGGNLLNFNVGDTYFSFLPRLFWVELQTRFGNQYYVKDHGEDGAVIDAINAIEICLEKGGCRVVPGLPKEQYFWTLSTSILGGLVAGFSAAPRKEDEIISWGFLALLSPLWAMLFGVFGLTPIISRTNDIIPLLKNGLAFTAATIVGYLLSQTIFSRYKES